MNFFVNDVIVVVVNVSVSMFHYQQHQIRHHHHHHLHILRKDFPTQIGHIIHFWWIMGGGVLEGGLITGGRGDFPQVDKNKSLK